jgi:hypothetical protein
MAKIYYVGGSTSSNGILRCILPVPHLSDLMQAQQFVYLGASFPSDSKGGPPATILEISSDERPDAWQSGFYRAHLPPLEFEDALRDLDSSPAARSTARELVP